MTSRNSDGVRGLILTGGLGVRLRPLTLTVPKPLLPLGDSTPVIEVLIRRLAAADVRVIHVALGYLGRLLRAYLEAIPNLGARCELHQEETPLGTAGPLAALPADVETAVVCNGDLLTDLDFRALLKSHRRTRADITVVSVDHEIHIPYGSLSVRSRGKLTGWDEGRRLRRRVSAGIYAINRRVIDQVRPGVRLDMPDLVKACLKRRAKVQVFKHNGVWFDIGDMAQYERAAAAFADCPRHFIPAKS